jgi:hypothetical protein
MLATVAIVFINSNASKYRDTNGQYLWDCGGKLVVGQGFFI